KKSSHRPIPVGQGARDVVPPIVTPHDVVSALRSFDQKPYRLRTIVEALAEERTTIGLTDDESGDFIRTMMRTYLKTEAEPTEMGALERLFLYFLAPPVRLCPAPHGPGVAPTK